MSTVAMLLGAWLVLWLANPREASGFRVYNKADITIRAQVPDGDGELDPNDFDVRIDPGDSAACHYTNDDCNDDEGRFTVLQAALSSEPARWACRVSMQAGGWVVVEDHTPTYGLRIDSPSTSFPTEYQCTSYNVDGSQRDQDPKFCLRPTCERDVRFLVTADPQIDNGFEDDAAETVDKTLRRLAELFGGGARRGVLVAGDLTQNSRPLDEFHDYRSSIEDHTGVRHLDRDDGYYHLKRGGVSRGFIEALGNHDYDEPSSTQADACTTLVNTCVDPVAIRLALGNRLRLTRFTNGIGNGEFASWDWQDVHFINAGVAAVNGIDYAWIPADDCPAPPAGGACDVPGTPAELPPDGLDRVQDDLERFVGDSGRPVILMQHYGFDDFSINSTTDEIWWTAAQRRALWEVLAPYNVVAIFAGHQHPSGCIESRPDCGRSASSDHDQWQVKWTRPSGTSSGPAEIPTYVAGATFRGIYLDVSIGDDTGCLQAKPLVQSCLKVTRRKVNSADFSGGLDQEWDVEDAQPIRAPIPRVAPAIALTGTAETVPTQPSTYHVVLSETASRGTPTGTVTFTSDLSEIAGCVDVPVDAAGEASCTTTLPTPAGPAQTYAIRAKYSGDADYYLAKTSAVHYTSVGDDNTQTTLAVSDNPADSDTEVVVTARVTTAGLGADVSGGELTFGVAPHGDAQVLADGCQGARTVEGGTVECTLRLSSVTGATVGLTADYGGSPVYDPSQTASPLVLTVKPASTVTVTNDVSGFPVVGQPVRFTAKVTVAPGLAAPTGTVSFTDDDGQTIPGCVNLTYVAAGVTCGPLTRTSVTQTGRITASYSGNATLSASRGSLIFAADGASTATTVTTDPEPSVTDQAVTATATVSAVAPGAGTPEGYATFKVGGSIVEDCEAVEVIAGEAVCPKLAFRPSDATKVVTVDFLGSGVTNVAAMDFTPSTGSHTHQVNAVGTRTSLNLFSVTPPATGQVHTYTANVQIAGGAGIPQGGTVSFSDQDGVITGCSALSLDFAGQAHCQAAFRASQSERQITATYSGSTDYATSSSDALSRTVIKQTPRLTLSTSDTSPVSGQVVTHTATLSLTYPTSLSGTVDFYAGSTKLAECTGVAVASLKATCTTRHTAAGWPGRVSAVFVENADFEEAQDAINLAVGKATTTMSLSASETSIVSGESVTYTATPNVSAPGTGTPTGTVTFKDGASVLCEDVALSSGDAACTTTSHRAANPPSVTAVYGGDSNLLTSTSGSVAITVTKAASSVSVTASKTSLVSGESVTYTATPAAVAPGSGTPGGHVEFYDGDTVIGGCDMQPISNGTGTCTTSHGAAAGARAIRAKYLGDSSYSPSARSEAISVTVGPAQSSTVIGQEPATVAFGRPYTVTATVAAVAPGGGTPQGTVTFYRLDRAISGAVPLVDGVARTNLRLALPGLTIEGRYSGSPQHQPSSGSKQPAVTFTRVITGNVGNQTLTNGAYFITNARISGSLTVGTGASVAIRVSTMNSLTAAGGDALVACASDLGRTRITDAKGFVLLGDTAEGCTTGNTLALGQIERANAGLSVSNNTITTSLSVTDSHGTPLFPDSHAITIAANRIGFALSCSGNNPAPHDDNRSNQVLLRLGQCAEGSFAG